jgi:hypothetical protein
LDEAKAEEKDAFRETGRVVGERISENVKESFLVEGGGDGGSVRDVEEDMKAGCGGGGYVAVARRRVKGGAIVGDGRYGGVLGLAAGRGLFRGPGVKADLFGRGRRLFFVYVDHGSM